jgi:4-hydroxybenzoyl-CoA reductase subunit beta
MLLPAHDYDRPASLSEALALLREGGGRARVIAGGTDLVFNMRGMLETPERVVSIRSLPELRGVATLADGSLRVGAGERLADLSGHPDIAPRYPALAAAIRSVASLHVRNMATLGGNLCLQTRCWYTNQSEEWRAGRGPCLKTGTSDCHVLRGTPVCVALNNSDVAPLLIAMRASATLAGPDGCREVALAGFYTSDGIAHTVLAPDEVLTAVTIPPEPRRLIYLKQTSRTGLDFSWATIAAAAGIHEGRVESLDLVLGSLTTQPLALRAPAGIVLEQGLGDAAIAAAQSALRAELGALTNLYTPAAYKRELARALLGRALRQLREE